MVTPSYTERLSDHAQDLDADGHLQAAMVPYDPTVSGLTATDAQAAIDELSTGGSGSVMPWFDVEDYGAVHDAASDSDADIAAATDDTPAIQAAFDDCVAAGGGTVFFPNGIYAIKGALQSTSTYNSQLTIPQTVYAGGTNGPIAIRLLGMGPASQSNHGTSGAWRPSLSGAILRSDWAGTITNFPAVIAAGRWDAVYPAASFNWVEITVDNVEVRTPANPKLTGWNLAACAAWRAPMICASTATSSSTMVLPTHTNAFGIMSPLRINVNPPGDVIGNVDGFYTGYLVNEIFHGINITSQHCVVAMQCDGPQNHAASIDRFVVIACQYAISVTGGVFYLNIALLDMEWSSSGTFATITDIYDPSNYLRGFIAYHKQEFGGSFSSNAELTRNGGARLSLHHLWAAGSGTATYKFTDIVEHPAAIIDPSTNPASGGFFYAANATGHPTWRDSAGAVTDLLAASALTIKDEGSSLATAATSIDFVGAGVVASGTTAAKTVTVSGAPTGAAGGDLSGTYPNPSVVDDSHAHTAATLPTVSGHELLISSTPSNPIVFADVILNSAGTDFLYSS